MQSLEEFQRLFESRRHQEAAAGAQLAHEELEHRDLLHAGIVIALHHRELVEIGEQRAVRGVPRKVQWWVHAAISSTVMRCAPRLIISSSARCPSPGRTSTARIASISSSTS